MLTMAICVPSTGGHEAAVDSMIQTMHCYHPSRLVVNDTTDGDGTGYLHKLQAFYEDRDEDILGYLHADLTIRENDWDKRVLHEFEDDAVSVVSFGGSKQHGTRDIYKIPYSYTQLARSPFISNLTDAEVHGFREVAACDVAVVDSFSMFVRRSFLDSLGGWPTAVYPPSHCSDYWLCLSVHHRGLRIRMVGVNCTHTSGGVGQAGWDYAAWCKTTKWGSDTEMHRVGHHLIYDQFRDILPVVIP